MKFTILLTLATFYLTLYIFSPISASAQDVTGLLLTVNSGGDSHDADPGDRLCADAGGQCTLRAAIEESNATAAADVIIFALAQPSTINLTSELAVTSSMEIVGPGARRLNIQPSTAPGTSPMRVFHVNGNSIRLKIRGLTMRGGQHVNGGGMLIEGGANVSLIDSAVRNNAAEFGGGIAIYQGNLVILRALLAQNTSSNSGGAIFISGSSSSVSVTCSTITENSAVAGGGIHNLGNLLLINDTIIANAGTQTGNIINSTGGVVRVLNTIIGRSNPATIDSLKGEFSSLGNNLITDSRASIGFVNGVNNDQVSENNTIDPMLGNLTNNGGQSDTLALLTGSPALGNANICVVNGNCSQLPGALVRGAYDQRRYYRNDFAGGGIDIGAFEQVQFVLGVSSSVFGIFGNGVNRHAGSLVIRTNARTLDKRYALMRLNGTVRFPNTILGDDFNDDYVWEFKSKRSGLVTPIVIPFEP